MDPNDVMMTGENSFVRLSHDGGKTLADRWSHWRVLWCPAGPGHVLLAQAELTGGKPRIYSDNIAMTRWLQKEIESMLFPPTADLATPGDRGVLRAQRGSPRGRDGARRLRQRRDRHDLVRLQRPVRPHDGAGYANRPIGVFSTFFPARAAQVTLNGQVAAGSVWPETRGDRQSSSACLAWSETWVKPKA